MNGFTLFNGPCAYVELRQGTLQILEGEQGLELPLERGPGGRLTDACRERLVTRLQAFFKRTPWQPRPRALCALGARGVSLRRLSLPPTAKENLQRVVLLQVEAEFPVPPDDLAWGFRTLGESASHGNGPGGKQDVLVAAVKKESVEEYADLLAQCGVTPVFTLAALARNRLCAQPPPAYAILDIGRYASELVFFEHGVPSSLRIVPWGEDTITRALGERLQISRNEAEALKLKLETAPPFDGEVGPDVEKALEAALDGLVVSLNGYNLGRRIYLTGKGIRQNDLATRLARRLGSSAECQPVPVSGEEGRTAAILGLQQLTREGEAPLILQVKPTNGHAAVARPAPWKWVGIVAGLALGLLLLPYLEALTLKPHLARKLAAVKRETSRLAVIDRELNFLEYLKQSQPPYLDTLYVFAKSAPPGARLDSISMNRRGELTWRGSMKDLQQVADFRSKLIDSGLFGNVTVEEQTPSPDRQKLSVRMSAQWKTPSPRQLLALGPTPEEIEKARTNVHQPTFGAPMFPPGMEGSPAGPMPPTRRPPRGAAGPGAAGSTTQVMPGSAMPVMPGGPNPPPGQNP